MMLQNETHIKKQKYTVHTWHCYIKCWKTSNAYQSRYAAQLGSCAAKISHCFAVFEILNVTRTKGLAHLRLMQKLPISQKSLLCYVCFPDTINVTKVFLSFQPCFTKYSALTVCDGKGQGFGEGLINTTSHRECKVEVATGFFFLVNFCLTG